VGGRDATSNEVLIKKHLDASDLVFHAEYHGAPFFIVKNPEKKDVPEATKSEAAIAAGSYSRAWGGGKGSCDVYYVSPEQVSKTPPSGEYLTKGAFMIYGKKNYFRGVDLKIAVGFRVGDSVEVIGGPVGAIAKQTRHYAEVGVGDVKSGELARKIKVAVLGKAGSGDADKIKSVGLSDIQYWIPSGTGRLI
ncbi:MAG: NFACT RNA binding domain-containing protein, partial [Candidatus Altiarchaeota archaeon]|nr:NFACT RNA binding domain-containing protein [Candidatus Altiarchaeota archaeon]